MVVDFGDNWRDSLNSSSLSLSERARICSSDSEVVIMNEDWCEEGVQSERNTTSCIAKFAAKDRRE